MNLSSEGGVAFTAARAAQDVLAAFAAPARAACLPRHEPASPVVARGTIALWRPVDLDVSAVIGHRGTAAVLRRALATVRRTHGWLPDPSDGASFDVCVKSLDDALEGRGKEEAAAGVLAVQMDFRSLLATLVGNALTGQLLGAAWPDPLTRGERTP
jgi:hypothetical protein